MNHAMCGAPEAATHPQRAPARPSAFCSWPTNRSLLSHFLFWPCAWSRPGLWRRHAILCLQDVGDAVNRAHRCCPCPALAYKAWQDGDFFIFIKLMHNSVSGTLQTGEAAGVVPLTLSRFLCTTPTASTSPPNSTTMKNFRNAAVGAIHRACAEAAGPAGRRTVRLVDHPLHRAPAGRRRVRVARAVASNDLTSQIAVTARRRRSQPAAPAAASSARKSGSARSDDWETL